MRTLRVLTVACLLALALPLAAFGAPAASTATPAPTSITPPQPAPAHLGLIDVQMWPEADVAGNTVVVATTLPTTTALPALVVLPVPVGARITWAGEILPGGPNADIQRQPKIVAGDGGQVVQIVVSKSRTIQYEAQLAPVKKTGGQATAVVEWVQSAASDVTFFSVKVPVTATNVKTDPSWTGAPATNDLNEKLYSVPGVELAKAAKVSFAVTYSFGGQVVPEATGSSDLTLPILLGLLVAAIAGLTWAIARQQRSRAGAPVARAVDPAETSEAPASAEIRSEDDWGDVDAEF